MRYSPPCSGSGKAFNCFFASWRSTADEIQFGKPFRGSSNRSYLGSMSNLLNNQEREPVKFEDPEPGGATARVLLESGISLRKLALHETSLVGVRSVFTH